MKSVDADQISALTKQIIHNTFTEGDYELWYSCLCHDSVFICNGEPMLIGDVAIRSHFDEIPKIKSNLEKLECSVQSIGDSGAVCYGFYVLEQESSKIFATIYFTVTYTICSNKPKILTEHLFYDFHVQKKSGDKNALTIDLNTVDFVRTLLLNIGGSRVKIGSGSQTLFIDPSTVLYVDSRKNKTEFVCVDRNVSCNQSIGEIKKLLPDYFYPLRRGNLVNLHYVVALRRFEIELISNIIIPIPARNFHRVKEEITAYLSTVTPIIPQNSI